METDSFDQQIAGKKAEIEAVFGKMDDVVSELQREVEELALGFYQQMVNSEVRFKPEVVQSLGVERLRELKAELRDLQGRVPGIVREGVGADENWAHRDREYWLDETTDASKASKYTFDDYKVYTGPSRAADYRGTDKLSWPLRRVLGEVGTLLIKYGFTKENEDLWLRQPYPPDSKLTYKGNDYGSAKVGVIVGKYKKLGEELQQLKRDLYKIHRSKISAAAQSLWDEA